MSGYRYEKHRELPVHILGKDFICREPSYEEQADYEGFLRSKDLQDDVAGYTLDFMEKLGVPKEYSKKLPLVEVLSLLSYLRGSDLDKKK